MKMNGMVTGHGNDDDTCLLAYITRTYGEVGQLRHVELLDLCVG